MNHILKGLIMAALLAPCGSSLAKNAAKTEAKGPTEENVINEQDLYNNPGLFNTVINEGMNQHNLELLGALLPLYRDYPARDAFLSDYASAYLAREEGDFAKAVRYYQELVAKQPNEDILRFQLAQVLFANRQDIEAGKELAILKQKSLPKDFAEGVKRLEEMLEERRNWHYSISGSALYEKNVNGASSVEKYGNWTFDTKKKTGYGINVGLSAEKQLPLQNGFFIPASASANWNWYWNAGKYNDLNMRAQAGIGWHNGRQEISAEPFISRRFVGNKGYSNHMGLATNWRYALTPQWQIRAYNQTSEERHDERKHLNGTRVNSGATLIYQPQPETYYFAGANNYYNGARDSEDRYTLNGGNVGFGKRWENGLNSTASFSYSFRKHKGKDLLNIVRQDKIYRLRLGAGHEKLSWKGFEPLFTVDFTRTDSNHPLYDRPFDWNVNMELLKRF